MLYYTLVKQTGFEMNISTVAENLRNTISGKEYMLQELQGMKFNEIGKNLANDATIEFLKVNIDELRRILQDVEKCVEKDVEQSWRDNPDRMGGQFSQDEIDNAEKW